MTAATRNARQSRRALGTPVVLVNAFPVDRSQWEPLLKELAGIDGFRGDVMTFDMPGIGDMPLSDEEPSLDLIADAAVLAMREATGHVAATWIGSSMGGYVVLAVAQRHPDAVAAVGLIGTRSRADDDAAIAQRLALASQVERAAGHPNPRGAAEGLVGTEGADREKFVSHVEANIARQGGAGIAWGQRAMAARPNRTAVLRGLEVPAVVIRGERDGIASAADAQEMAQALGVQVVEVAGVGHLTALEAPAAVASALSVLFADEASEPA